MVAPHQYASSFLVTLWRSNVQAVGTIFERVFEEVVDRTKRLDFFFLLEGEGPRLIITGLFRLR